MFKKSLKAIVTSVFVFSMLSTGIICSADETSAVTTTTTSAITTRVGTTTTSAKANTNRSATTTTTTKKSSSSSVTTTTTTTTTGETTTSSSDTTTTTVPVTTTTVPATTTTTAPITTTTAPTTTTTQETTTTTTYVGEGTQYIFDDIDKILYDDTLTTAKKTSEINKYLYKKALSHEIPMNVILDIKKDVNSVLNSQSESTKVSNDIKNSLDSYLNSVSASNGSSIESICTNLIKSAFKQGVYDAQETVKLLKSLHSNIESRVEQAKAEEIANGIYDHYEFVSSANALNGLSGYSDLQGWIYIPNANIDYPIMHSTEDNDYYLQHDMNGYSSSQGCIELDYRCNLFANAVIDSSYTNNSIIYGHNLNNGVMFSNLARYKDPNYWNANKLIEVTTYSGQRLYEIYACCSVYGMGDGTQFNYWNAKYLNMDYELFQEYMYLTQETMLYQTGNFPTFGQDILTLQTCDGNDGWRIVVFAKRVK